jgi:Fe-S-cluster containining protein
VDPERIDTVAVEFSIGMGDKPFKARATVPAGQTNLTQILPVIQSLSSSLIDGIAAQVTHAGHSISCKSGCGACCRQLVPISLFEAEHLASMIRRLPTDQQQELERRFNDALTRLAATGILERLGEMEWKSESARQLALDYFYAGVPCPFLEQESCSIHPLRPIVCREFLVVSPPEHCADPAHLETKHVSLPIRFSRVLNAIAADAQPETPGWIPLVLLMRWMKTGARPGDAVSGTGPDVLYEFVKRLAQGKDAAPNPEQQTRA